MVLGFVTSNMTKVLGRQPQGCIGNWEEGQWERINGRLFTKKQKQASTWLCTIFTGLDIPPFESHSAKGEQNNRVVVYYTEA